VIVSGIHDRLPRGRSLGRGGLRAESGRLGERGAAGGGQLGSLADLAAACRIELCIRFRDKPDVERPPDRQDERSAPGRRLAGSWWAASAIAALATSEPS
jgi:hypothetical protein